MRISVRDGKVTSDGEMEVNAVHHCNLRCRSCVHLSPMMSPHFVDPERLSGDAQLLSESYRARTVKVLGGEPLLHPELVTILRGLRASGVADRILVCTNGLLLERYGAELWREVDEIEISLYPGRCVSNGHLARFRTLAADHGVVLTPRLASRFREPFLWGRHSDVGLVQSVFRTCQQVHLWGCHTLHGGFLYRCPPALFLGLLAHREPDPTEAIRLRRGPGFLEELHQFLCSPVPPATCWECLGSVGRAFPHEQFSRTRWREQSIAAGDREPDWEFMAALERNISTDAGEARVLGPDEDIPDRWRSSRPRTG